jgi:hypothetical protein
LATWQDDDVQGYLRNGYAESRASENAAGRGWAVVKGERHGMIYFLGGDDSEYVAKKAEGQKRAKRK